MGSVLQNRRLRVQVLVPLPRSPNRFCSVIFFFILLLIAFTTQKVRFSPTQTKQVPLKQITEEIYHIVNIDMSRIVGSLPEPFTIQEAMRLRERPEIKSYRSIFLSWCENMYRVMFRKQSI